MKIVAYIEKFDHKEDYWQCNPLQRFVLTDRYSIYELNEDNQLIQRKSKTVKRILGKTPQDIALSLDDNYSGSYITNIDNKEFEIVSDASIFKKIMEEYNLKQLIKR